LTQQAFGQPLCPAAILLAPSAVVSSTNYKQNYPVND